MSMIKENKYLIVVDMQNDFITGVLGTPEARAIVPAVTEKIKNFDGTVIYTQDTHSVKYLETQEGRKLPIEHCIQGTEGWQLEAGIKKLAEKAGSQIFMKPGFGSLIMTAYMSKLNAEKLIDSIEIVGLCTDICVLSAATLCKVAFPEVPIIVDSSCCAGVTPESHETALKAMKGIQIDVI